MGKSRQRAGISLNQWLSGVSLILATTVVPAAEEAGAKLPLAELATFTDVMQKIKEAYIEPVSDKTLLSNAIQGMLVRLDPHSSFLEPEAVRDLQEMTEGAFVGVGLEVSVDKAGEFKVIAPIEGGPAARAGMQTGDRLVRIDQKVLRGLSLKEVHDRLRGEAGVEVQLSVQRGSATTLLEFKFKRERIEVKNLDHKLLAPGIGYLRLYQFQQNSAEQLIAQLDAWQKQQPLEGLILDLRNNPGGLVGAAVDIVDAFIDSGAIVSTKGRLAQSNFSMTARPGDRLNGAPLVILINGGSASASEIVAGALQDHKRALILGKKSFGKGSVQTVLPVQGNKALKLTTALYYTPSGRSIQAEGIEPDVDVGPIKLPNQPDEALARPKERDLPAALANGNGRAARSDAAPASNLAYEDFQLFEAFNLVRAMRWGRKP